MGLFSRKPKSVIMTQPGGEPASGDDAMDRMEELLPRVGAAPPLAKPWAHEPPAKGAKRMKAPKPNKKFSVDPIDVVALRAELVDMRARLDESEQARASVEARLSSLDAAASQFTTERQDITEVANMVIQLQHQVAERARDAGSARSSASNEGAHDELSVKADALQNRFFGPPLGALRPDPETPELIAAVQQRVNDLDEILHRLGDIGHLQQRMEEIDALHQRIAGVEALHERIGEVDQRLAGVDGLAMQLQEIGERLRVSEETQANNALLSSGASEAESRAVRDHMALLDQRLTNISTELANQLSELGRDIDGLGQRAPEGADDVFSDEVVDALKGGQVKLANEQARYEIAFREDLAALAEQLRKARPNS